MGVFRSFAAACTVAVLVILLQGCGAIVRSAIDTQPRVSLTAEAFSDPSAIVHGAPVIYAPGNAEEAIASDPDLARFAPIVVQGFQAKDGAKKYPYSSDAIGTPALSADGDDVRIDTSQPAVFARVEQALVGEISLKQLVYVFWYPERPVGSIEKGDIDGGILRITLDAAGTPSVFEYSQPCGCFHGVFVADHVEAAARQQFASVARERLYAVEAPLGGHADWVVRDLVHVESSYRPVLYMSAGKHFCEAIRFEEPPAASGYSGGPHAYALRPYSALERLPRAGGRTGSMFNEKGLVHGGKRWKENLVLAGLDNPGWPRHLDQMKIHWDRDTWTDQRLLEKRLRLPAAVTGQVATAAPGQQGMDVTPGAGDEAPGPVAEGERPVLILFTNRYCIGCEEVKRVVLSDPFVQSAIAYWDYRAVDTAEPAAAALAARHRVSVTPVLVAFDREGRELLRSEEIETSAKLLAVIAEARSKEKSRG